MNKQGTTTGIDVTALWQQKQQEMPKLFKSGAADQEVEVFEVADQYSVLLSYNKKHALGKRPSQYAKLADQSAFSLHNAFDPAKFSFQKASKEEHIAEPSDAGLMVNISPVYDSHSLYLPFLSMKCPQFIAHANILQKVLDFYHFEMQDASNYVIGYNSAGACSSVNNLHFQVMDVELIKSQHGVTQPLYGEWHIDRAEVTQTRKSEETGFAVDVCQVAPEGSMLKSAIVLKWGEQSEETTAVDTKYISQQIFSVLNQLHQQQMPYNLEIYNSSILIVPRFHQSKATEAGAFNPAFFEFFGMFRINKEALWEKGLQHCYDYCLNDVADFTEVPECLTFDQ